MFVCTLTGRTSRRNSSRLCRTTLNLFYSPEIRHGAEEVNHTPFFYLFFYFKKRRRRKLAVVYIFLTTLTVSVNLDSVCCPNTKKKTKKTCASNFSCVWHRSVTEHRPAQRWPHWSGERAPVWWAGSEEAENPEWPAAEPGGQIRAGEQRGGWGLVQRYKVQCAAKWCCHKNTNMLLPKEVLFMLEHHFFFM